MPKFVYEEASAQTHRNLYGTSAMITYATSGNFASLSQVKPNFGNGVTFQNSSETLDFYANGTVVYKSGNAPSRRGDWTVDLRGQRKQIGNVTKDVPITVSIYIYIR